MSECSKWLRWLAVGMLLGLFGCAPGEVRKEETAQQREQRLHRLLQIRLSEAEGNSELLSQVMRYAQMRNDRCRRCHEVEGRSKTPNMPLLAGQNPFYTISQFLRFADGRRADFNMRMLTQKMADDDMINLAIYYSRMEIQPLGGGSADQQRQGKVIFTTQCIQCHGENARGKQLFPSLAGQQWQYVTKRLQEFSQGEEGPSAGSLMVPIAKKLSPSEIESVAAYVANLK